MPVRLAILFDFDKAFLVTAVLMGVLAFRLFV